MTSPGRRSTVLRCRLVPSILASIPTSTTSSGSHLSPLYRACRKDTSSSCQGGGFGLFLGSGCVLGNKYKQGGGNARPLMVVALLASPLNFGQGRPGVPHSMSQITTPSTRSALWIILAPSRVWIPDHALCFGFAPAFWHNDQMMNSSA